MQVPTISVPTISLPPFQMPAIQGTLRRRILANYLVEPQVMQRYLPPPFQLKLHQGFAVAGLCLIRLEHVRPRGIPEFIGLSSENAAHRVAVTFQENGVQKEGVFIWRRDTNSQVHEWLGGHLFPGDYQHATFEVQDQDPSIALNILSQDQQVKIFLKGQVQTHLPETSVFADLQTSSAFFEAGSVGYSPDRQGQKLDAMELKTRGWEVHPLGIEHIRSSFFDNQDLFPAGSIRFDHALIMRDLEHEWHGAGELRV
ncbi:DUF2071 domain-containing protein [Deinococcus roseus]|uniref:DUF2071 domain-containing protein n=1 Tax=Deinococcus roseus TaxID=392414 RepID=A0ABQ2CWH5_9DEIO|nr:DUF2071 domain-containing protein [Deinococcus roseus]GGJ27649.1 hypothetical protein GCM10008938_12180 [Deinococcus roseus]